MTTQSEHQNQRPVEPGTFGASKQWPHATGGYAKPASLLDTEASDLDAETVEAMLTAKAAKATIV